LSRNGEPQDSRFQWNDRRHKRAYIGDVVHRAVIDVSEEGTEAAAATGVGFRLVSVPMSFEVTRPFLFYIVDDATGAILFQGRIIDPRAAS
jgi:serpin B